MSFPRYPKYKPSEIEWLDEMPSHWVVKRLKHACTATPSNVDKKTHEGETAVRLCNYTDVYYNDYITSDLDFMEASASSDQIVRFSLKAGDTIITKDSETADDIAVAAYVPQDIPGVVCGYHLSIVRPKSNSVGAFMKWLLGSRYARSYFEVSANGLTRVGLGQYEIDNLAISLPPVAEQDAIAKFLDRETAKIDALVAEQERLIELLKEKRQAVISHAVTKGLDLATPMKPSGIDWLGDQPAHWRCAQLTRIADRVVVGIAEAATHAYADNGIPILRSTNIHGGRVVGDVLFVDPAFANDRGSKRLQTGDLVTVRTGNAGATAVVPSDLDGCQCFTMLITTLKQSESPTYFCYWLNSVAAQCYFLVEGWGTAQVNISVPILKAIHVPVPPRPEQNAIVAWLDRTLDELDALADEAQRAIDLLQERRSALISAAVTGQIDVRNAVPVETA